jgi:hypothetical protein
MSGKIVILPEVFSAGFIVKNRFISNPLLRAISRLRKGEEFRYSS